MPRLCFSVSVHLTEQHHRHHIYILSYTILYLINDNRSIICNVYERNVLECAHHHKLSSHVETLHSYQSILRICELESVYYIQYMGPFTPATACWLSCHVFPEEILQTYPAYWWSGDGVRLAYLSINNTHTPYVEIPRFTGGPYPTGAYYPYPKVKCTITIIIIMSIKTTFIHLNLDKFQGHLLCNKPSWQRLQ